MDDHNHRSNSGTSAVAWIALIIAILAAVLAWAAFNRTGTDLEQRIQTEVREAANETQDTTQDATQEIRESTRDAGQAIDEGPDGVDEDDTNLPQTTQPQQ